MKYFYDFVNDLKLLTATLNSSRYVGSSAKL